jgi:DNA polymerase III epsilon subunit-like protein
MNGYSFYSTDTETTGLDAFKHDIIELSLIRLTDDEQKTWFIKPLNFDTIELGALRVNGHKLEDLRGETKYGQDTYLEASKAIVEIENWVCQDGFPAEARFLVGHNAAFDKLMLEQTWRKCQAFDSFPFGRRVIDTMIVELFLDYCQGQFAEGYSLNNLSKKYGIKNADAHSAAADTKCATDVFKKQVAFFKQVLGNKS